MLAEKTGDVGRRTEKWAGAIEAGMVRWIALNPDPSVSVEDRVIGFSSPGPSRDEDAPTPLELYAIYVREKWWGSGLGYRLLDVAIGKEPASLWVLEGNQRARAFYRRRASRRTDYGWTSRSSAYRRSGWSGPPYREPVTAALM